MTSVEAFILFSYLLIFRKIAGAICVGAGRKSIESGLAKSLTERNHQLDHLFRAETLKLKEKKKKDDEDSSESEDDLEIDDGYQFIERIGVRLILQ